MYSFSRMSVSHSQSNVYNGAMLWKRTSSAWPGVQNFPKTRLVGTVSVPSGWEVMCVSMGLHGRVRMKPKQTAELLLRPLRKQLHLPGWTLHHTPYKPFMVVAQRPAATSQAMPAPFLYLTNALQHWQRDSHKIVRSVASKTISG